MATTLPMVEDLRKSNWARLAPEERLAALQNFENQLATQEQRNPCQVKLIPSEVLAESQDPQNLYGQHVREHANAEGNIVQESIYLNPHLLSEEMELPYPVVETYFHEARHSYQDLVADNPELAETPQQADDFFKAKNGGYLYESDKFVDYQDYRCQPTEIDANHVGQTRTRVLYEQFGELDDCLDYHFNSEEYQIQRDWFMNENLFKDDARALVDKKFELTQKLSREREGSVNNIEKPAEEIDISQQSEDIQSPNHDNGEDYDYSYGYGPQMDTI